jgi:hypothetical protein
MGSGSGSMMLGVAPALSMTKPQVNAHSGTATRDITASGLAQRKDRARHLIGARRSRNGASNSSGLMPKKA